MLGGVRIKLVRWGFRNKPFYVLSVMYRRSARNTGKRFEDVGWWDPNPAADGNMHLGLKFDRIKYWLTAGAQPTPKVTDILGRLGIIPERPKPPSYFEGERPMPKWKAGTDKE
ncbi:hypothetical protein CEUSTIGMA_g4965.t1 [Chlamydomonas eustigma]|uniref:30S ribosomal protein S16, chloroplastic n=1 Tax=Chlamydomonas eustigma TaxID=1157962 RepID=A0A250X389_9CHLO|nr:hypothetical protein CEUSTIGMA_g4965.t1 [Chlamydomonas eustigma]|eukprot:GAX77521.1 hypothetical protein CEUSTIGMA_g4965.t1 [Chlamydomonas eustigma]